MCVCGGREQATYSGMALEAKVDHHNRGQEDHGKDGGHQEEVQDDDQGIGSRHKERPSPAGTDAPTLHGKQLVIHIVGRKPRNHPRYVRQIVRVVVIHLLVGHLCRNQQGPSGAFQTFSSIPFLPLQIKMLQLAFHSPLDLACLVSLPGRIWLASWKQDTGLELPVVRSGKALLLDNSPRELDGTSMDSHCKSANHYSDLPLSETGYWVERSNLT